MHKILILSYYIDNNHERNNEIIHCFEQNLKSGFDYIVILSEVNSEIFKKNINNKLIADFNGKILFKKISSRPTYNDFFRISKLQIFKQFEQKLFFIINIDIYFENINKVLDFYTSICDKKNTVLALSRWDIKKDNSVKYVDRIDSQDAWIFYDEIDFLLNEDFQMGIPGCDNRLAYELYKNNYNILNPSNTIKIYHYHISNIRRYVDDNEIHEPFMNKESIRINGPYYLLDQYEKLLNSNGKKKIISFSLYGNNPKYCVGAIENVKLASHIYPDWICRFYISKDVDINWIIRLKKHKNVEIFIVNDETNENGMFWKFFAMADDIVDVMISRDCDSRLCMREKNAVDEWLLSDKGFHIIRDHPYHTNKILGGMFGYKKGCLKNFIDLYKTYVKPKLPDADQYFLLDVIYPLVQNNSIIHDEFIENKPFPTARSKNKKFVGEIYDENNIRNQEHYKLIP